MTSTRSELQVFVPEQWASAMSADYTRFVLAGDDEYTARLKSDFRNFLFVCWQHLGLPAPTPVQYDIALCLQHGPKRLIIEAFRGVGKSWITSAFVCWLLLRNPDDKVLVVSASKVRADDFSTFTKRLIAEMPCLAHLAPGEGQRDSNVAFDVGPARAAHAPSVKSLGITSQLTGSRADWIIPDDIEVPNNSQTQLMRDKLGEQVKEFDAILSPKPGSSIRFLGTPQCEMSVYNTLADRGYTIRVWPARLPTKVDTYKGRLAPSVADMLDRGSPAGTPIEPTRFGHQDLVEREGSYGRSGFALQFMLDTTVSDSNRYPLKLADLIVLPLSNGMVPVQTSWGSGPDQVIQEVQPVGLQGDRWHRPMFYSKEWVPLTDITMAIDPSGRGTNETAYAVVGYREGVLFLLDAGGFRDGYSEPTLQALALVAKRWKATRVRTESNFGDGMFTKLFEPVLRKVWTGAAVEEDRSSVQKEKRIVDTLEPILNQHRLVVGQDVITKDAQTEDPRYQLFYQLTRITREKGALAVDDRVDVLAMAASVYIEHLDVDPTGATQRHKDALLEQEVRKYLESIGQQHRPPSMLDSVLDLPAGQDIPVLH